VTACAGASCGGFVAAIMVSDPEPRKAANEFPYTTHQVDASVGDFASEVDASERTRRHS
jgi:hypothetical protein